MEEEQNPVIIQALWQIPLILLTAFVIGMGFNYFRNNSLPWCCKPQEGQELSIMQAARLFKENKAVFLDARPVDFYKKGHIKGALSLPYQDKDAQMNNVIDKIPPDAVIITYCDGPTCNLSHMLANFLKDDMGFENVHVLVNGWSLWLENRLPVER